MKSLGKFFACMLFGLGVATGVAGCGAGSGYSTDSPSESCYAGDYCNQGLNCQTTTLPASAGFSGNFCTSSCYDSSDCAQLVSNYDAICVNGQCYLQCPTGGSNCPYGQGCLTFDSNVGPVSLCSP